MRVHNPENKKCPYKPHECWEGSLLEPFGCLRLHCTCSKESDEEKCKCKHLMIGSCEEYHCKCPKHNPKKSEGEKPTEKRYLEYVDGYLTCTYDHEIGDECLMNRVHVNVSLAPQEPQEKEQRELCLMGVSRHNPKNKECRWAKSWKEPESKHCDIYCDHPEHKCDCLEDKQEPDPQGGWKERFDTDFGDNVVWWQECLVEMRIGDPDFKRLKAFIASEIAEAEKKEASKYMKRNWVNLEEVTQRSNNAFRDRIWKEAQEKSYFYGSVSDELAITLSNLKRILYPEANETT